MRTYHFINTACSQLKSISLLFCALNIMIYGYVQGRTTSPVETNDMYKVKQRVHSLLSVWFEDKNIKNALTFFSSTAFSNKAMLSNDCCGYLKDSNRSSSEMIKEGVVRFLEDFSKNNKTKQQDILALLSERLYKYQNKLHNNPQEDGYLVLFLTLKELKNFLIDREEEYTTLHENLGKRRVFVSIIPVDYGLIYLLWLREKDEWYIYHAEILCM